jgi:hypothetical protein
MARTTRNVTTSHVRRSEPHPGEALTVANHSSLFDDPAFVSDLLDESITGGQMQAKWGMVKSAVNKWRQRVRQGQPLPVTEQGVAPLASEEIQRNSDESIISAVRMADTAWGLTEWRAFLREHGQDPDTVTFQYGVTSAPTGGFWNKLNNVRAKVGAGQAAVDWDAAAKFIDGFTYVPAKRDYLIDVAVLQPTDEQWGKTDFNGGTAETEERVLTSYSRFADYIREYRPARVLFARTGDGIENVCSTGSQRDTNDLDLPHMLAQLFKIDLHSLKMIAPLVGEVKDARVPSNHGRWRTGLKADAGNPHADFGIVVGRMLENTQRELGVFPNVEFLFPEKLMESMTVQLGGIRVGLVHGHQTNSPDRLGDWWGKQDHGRMPTWDADILFAGHFHSHRKYQSGDGRYVIVGPASDNGSSWFSNLQGERATAGMLAVCFEGKRPRFEEIL